MRLVKSGDPKNGPYFEFGAPPAIQRGSGKDSRRLFFGDPRYRQSYDVFALALVGALAAHLLLETKRPAAV
ncbi:MAG: hypothetical protein M3R54_02545 [Chloroflexota bacterium]|nr:hypothetical protein [Chloroflexota bacterium]